jgi:site-specific recombinase XerD
LRDFFTAQIRNPSTRRAYAQAIRKFFAWCEAVGISSITAVQPVHVAAYIEQLAQKRSTPTAKQRLAAVRHLFDWLVHHHTRRPAELCRRLGDEVD